MKINKIKYLFGICFISVSTIVAQKNTTLKFSTSIKEDATPHVLRKLMKLESRSNVQINFEKGTYHFYPDKGLESFEHISNHGDHMIRTAFPLRDFKNTTIDGNGATFVFHGIMIPFLVDGSENITIKNITIDWAQAFHSEGLIIAHNAEEHSFDMKISDEYPYEIRNEQLIFVKEYYEHGIGQSILYDPQRKAIAFDTESYTNISLGSKVKSSNNIESIDYKYEVDHRAPSLKKIGIENRLKVVQLKPGVVRLYGHKKKLPPVGMILVMKGQQGFNRVAPAFRVTHTKGFTGLNVNIHHAGGMGIIAENSSDLLLDNFNITPSHGRMVSTTADATHFVGCSGKVTLQNSTFNNQLDDATNVHGTYQKVVEKLDDYSIGVRMGHHQQQGFQIGNKGETIGLVRLSESFFAYDHLTLQSVEKLNSRYHIIRFNEKIPASLQPGDLIENLDGYPELFVKNCVISNNRARGLLISNPVSTVIENNFFSTEMEAILVPVESGHWYESGNASNVIIRNNTFQDCNHSGYDRGVIRFVTDDDNQNIAFKNIEITNNTFNHFDNLILEISNTDGLLFSKNTITNSGTFPQLFADNPVVKLKSSKNIVFKRNKYEGKAKEKIESDSNLTEIKFK
ncbi:right-handed parallel beta-helix repeat-containing protein [Flavicella sp.]|uniref:right-handed parallel beta-helix repeat-containing protein n=1 Tax=Flavicella sp. TaxID=2957742 RepID=UPI002625BBCF|nr:right-handed parallel beta-helix repeat-containing protein [Flavicella sp.]MDG1804366.1 right-handed parallel beta-helix repeat-containing protein [Flavicella sp.]